jgi:hypothetical protein
VTQYQVARPLKRFGVRPFKARIEAKPTNCYHRSDLEPAWTRYSLPVQVGTPEQTNETGPESMIAGRNRSTTGSDLKVKFRAEIRASFRRSELKPPPRSESGASYDAR